MSEGLIYSSAISSSSTPSEESTSRTILRLNGTLNHTVPISTKMEKRVGLEHRSTKQEWFELQQPQMAYQQYFEGPKIIYPDIGKELRFCDG